MKTRVKKDELLTIIRKNRNEHREIFEEALDGYKKKMITYLESMIVELRKGNRISHHISLIQPIDQTKEYDRAIKMFEMSVDDIVELDEESFANFVLDDWSWKDNFINSNSVYSAKAANWRK